MLDNIGLPRLGQLCSDTEKKIKRLRSKQGNLYENDAQRKKIHPEKLPKCLIFKTCLR